MLCIYVHSTHEKLYEKMLDAVFPYTEIFFGFVVVLCMDDCGGYLAKYSLKWCVHSISISLYHDYASALQVISDQVFTNKIPIFPFCGVYISRVDTCSHFEWKFIDIRELETFFFFLRDGGKNFSLILVCKLLCTVHSVAEVVIRINDEHISRHVKFMLMAAPPTDSN